MKKLEEEAFEASFKDLFTRAFLLANRILGDTGAAEDVAAEAMARAYAEWPKLHELAYRDAWVLRVTTNLAIDVTRRSRLLPDPGRTVDVQETAMLRVALGAALRALPRRQREAIALRYLAGFSEQEVAAALEVSAEPFERTSTAESSHCEVVWETLLSRRPTLTSPEMPRGPRFETERDLYEHVVSRGRRLRRNRRLVQWSSSALTLALVVGGISFAMTGPPTRRITLPATEAPTPEAVATEGEATPSMTATPTPDETPGTAGPAETPLVCRNSLERRCGPFYWDPAPAPNQPLSVEIMSYRPEHPKVGDMIIFKVRIRESDAGGGRASLVSFGGKHIVPSPSTSSCYRQRGYGPWTPPTPKGFDITVETLAVRLTKAGTFEAVVGASSFTGDRAGLCPKDAYDPYASFGKSSVSVVVSEASSTPTPSPSPSVSPSPSPEPSASATESPTP